MANRSTDPMKDLLQAAHKLWSVLFLELVIRIGRAAPGSQPASQASQSASPTQSLTHSLQDETLYWIQNTAAQHDATSLTEQAPQKWKITEGVWVRTHNSRFRNLFGYLWDCPSIFNPTPHAITLTGFNIDTVHHWANRNECSLLRQ